MQKTNNEISKAMAEKGISAVNEAAAATMDRNVLFAPVSIKNRSKKNGAKITAKPADNEWDPYRISQECGKTFDDIADECDKMLGDPSTEWIPALPHLKEVHRNLLRRHGLV